MAHRIERINSLIRQEISELLQRQVKDPRLGNFIAVTEVSTTPDLHFAKVFISSMGEDAEKAEVLAALKSAAGFFRTKLAKNLKMRYTPELIFQWDNSIERGDRLLRMIDEINQEN
ncbi:MAG: 30S ribosome-binding factor RbfA [Dehalococcoidales bacterium]|nr:30S ribosome-binding factor RbfA [Dehalococcoidales bacterium]